MDPIYAQDFTITENTVDRYGRLKTSMIFYLAQEVAGKHSNALQVGYDVLDQKNLFWAITRHRVQISRLPRIGETIRVETWPMPTSRVAYPRSMVAYDQNGQECFRSISLWVLVDAEKRSMVLPAKSGVTVNGILRGMELELPNGLLSKSLSCCRSRTVCFTDLDRNGHMNNTRYLDWVSDLLPSSFHEGHCPREITVCYFSEAREEQTLDLYWDFLENGSMQVDGYRKNEDKQERIFSARMAY